MRSTCFIGAILLLNATVLAATINVPGDFATIQEAVNAAVDGDQVAVAPGTYISTNDGPVVDMQGKMIILRATGTPQETIIDGQNLQRGLSCWAGETSATVIEGFTITNGNADEGGGLYCYNTDPTIINCIFAGGTATRGGGINCYGSNPSITGCTITGNTATRGGGLYCFNNSSPTVTNCTFSGNSGTVYAGGLFFIGGSPVVSSCIITGNTCDGTAAGIYCNGGTPAFLDCTISDNIAGDTGGGVFCFHNFPVITNCTISGNSSANPGGGISTPDGNPTVTDTLVCGNSPDQVHGTWTDNGGNQLLLACPQFPGACCTNGGCVIGPEPDCLDYLGTWLGEGTTCDDVSCPAACLGDANGDNQVDVNDILIVISQYGMTCP